MSAIPTLLASAIATVINTAVSASAFEQIFTAQHSYPDWDDDFKDLKDLAVDVVFKSSGDGGGDVIDLDTVSTLGTDVALDIAIRKRFEPSDRNTATGRLITANVNSLVGLVERIHVLLAEDRATPITLESGVHANWLEGAVRTYCDYKKLREGCFLGMIRVRFNVTKEVS